MQCKEHVHFGGANVQLVYKRTQTRWLQLPLEGATGKGRGFMVYLLKLYLLHIFFLNKRNKTSYVQSLCPI